MSRRARTPDHAPGQESFLDIVANLVGILIILVMVIGVRAQDAMLEAAPSASSPPGDLPDVATAQSAANALQSDIHEMDEKIRQQQFNIEYRRAERDRIQLLVQAAEQQLAERRDALDAAAQEKFDLQRQAVASRAELDKINSQIASLEASQPAVSVISHLPTPMAKTVFGKELHFRLSRGKLMHVPWDVLVEKLKAEAPNKLWRLQDQKEMTETLGPVAGFWMKYTLTRKQHATQTKVGVAVQQAIELDHFVLMPVTEDAGEPWSEAQKDGSAFQTLLAAHPPAGTTVTVWTYPDSFDTFRQVKQYLYDRGYLTASRPLPDGYPIGGSPEGRRSAAQ